MKQTTNPPATDRLAVMTNIVYVLADVMETNLMELEREMRLRGYALRHETKRDFNAAIAAARRLKGDVARCHPETQECFGDDADMVNALLLAIIDRAADDDRAALGIFRTIKAMPSRLGLDIEALEGAFPTDRKEEVGP